MRASGVGGPGRPFAFAGTLLRLGAAIVLIACGPEPTRVTQLPAGSWVSIERTDTVAIMNVAQGERLPIRCTVYPRDSTGQTVAFYRAQVAPSRRRIFGGTHCDSLVALRSGYDTIRVVGVSASAIRDLPIALAIRPVASSPTGDPVSLDQFPSGMTPWAPSARTNSRGQIELYLASYPVDSTGADLLRYVSSDSVRFRYDGTALRHDPDPCSPMGWGVENVVIASRAEAPGWRMFFASGSDDCYGWNVYSAVSTDERTWVVEQGVRLSDGGTPTPANPVPGPWPAGEGMVVDRIASSEWRMIASTYEHVDSADRWQITEWRSRDQLRWAYQGPVLTTGQLPPEGQGSVFSPTIREIAPGLFRMLFTADNRGSPAPRSGLWSAVSIDKRTWQLEGEVLGAPGWDLYYAALAGDRVYFLRRANGGPDVVASARVRMP
jgi:hypothetical protein